MNVVTSAKRRDKVTTTSMAFRSRRRSLAHSLNHSRNPLSTRTASSPRKAPSLRGSRCLVSCRITGRTGIGSLKHELVLRDQGRQAFATTATFLVYFAGIRNGQQFVRRVPTERALLRTHSSQLPRLNDHEHKGHA